jgi:hypothetical protein
LSGSSTASSAPTTTSTSYVGSSSEVNSPTNITDNHNSATSWGDLAYLLDGVSFDDESESSSDLALQDVDSTDIVNHELYGNMESEIMEVNLHLDVSTNNETVSTRNWTLF